VLKEVRRHRRFQISLFGTRERLDDGGHVTAFGICLIHVAPGELGYAAGALAKIGWIACLQPSAHRSPTRPTATAIGRGSGNSRLPGKVAAGAPHPVGSEQRAVAAA